MKRTFITSFMPNEKENGYIGIPMWMQPETNLKQY